MKLTIALLLIIPSFIGNGEIVKSHEKEIWEQKDFQNPYTLIDNEDYLILSTKKGEVKIIDEYDNIANYPGYEVITYYDEDTIIGKSVVREDLEIYRKYNPKKSFDDYKVPVYEGELADPDFGTNPWASMFSSRIEEACKGGINFAGHYTLAMWGCGTSCQQAMIVDRKTGKIYDAVTTSFGIDYRKDSKLLISNVGAIDTETGLIEVCSYCEVLHKVWVVDRFISNTSY
ncbi:hypothetical protein [Leptobacterium sp. I13]|uniref:hypothetical protein n=1 Tax=Leptobacterium meishanense TaxID=3128904 RepID=UPI0030EC2FDA